MLVLGLDTSSLVCTVAVSRDGVVIAEHLQNTEKTHSQVLVPMIDRVLREAGIDQGDLNAVAVGQGPGSFTGLRIGMGTAKGLSYGLGIPLVPVPTLDVVAANALGFHGLICPVFDARRKEFYTCSYRGQLEAGAVLPGEVPQRVAPYQACSLEELVEALLPQVEDTREPVLVLGNGADKCFTELQARFQERVVRAPRILDLPRGGWVALKAEAMLRATGGSGPDYSPLAAAPMYLRRSEAEIRWERGHREGG